VGHEVVLGSGRTMRIIGVVGDARLLNVDSLPAPTMYYSAQQIGFPSMWLTVRTTGEPAAAAAAVKRAVASLDPDLPVAQLQPLTQLVADATAQPRLTMLVFAIFATAALALAAIGLYGLISFMVVQRTREIGVRLALGALPRRIVRDVLGHGLRLAGIGVALGVAIAYAGTGLLRTILFEVTPTDPLTFGGVTVLLLAVAALASTVPARRASRLDPGSTLRAE